MDKKGMKRGRRRRISIIKKVNKDVGRMFGEIKMQDLVSIIVPVYRVEKYLTQCINSIISQTYKNIELILVDDGSDDGCPEICDKFVQADSRIKVIHKKNGGADDARKAGILAATGDYVGYVDGDDWIEPQMYERLIELANEHNVLAVESGIIDSTANSFTYRFSTFEEGCYQGKDFEDKIEPYILYSGKFFRLGIMASMCNKLFKKEYITKYQMMPDPSGNIVEDTFCALPCVAEMKSLYVTHECYYHYRQRLDSVKHEVRRDFEQSIASCYADWPDRFPFVRDKRNMKRQIQYYLMYLLLMKTPYAFDDVRSADLLEAYGTVHASDKIVVYGAGAAGVQIRDYVSKRIGENLVLWVDKNYMNLEGQLLVAAPEEILNVKYDFVIVAILWAERAQSAIDELVDMGVPEDKIKWILDEYINEPEKLLVKWRLYR